jgi:hypothetical protein
MAAGRRHWTRVATNGTDETQVSHRVRDGGGSATLAEGCRVGAPVTQPVPSRSRAGTSGSAPWPATAEEHLSGAPGARLRLASQEFCPFPRVTAIAERLDVLDAVCTTFGKRDDVVDGNHRPTPRRWWDCLPDTRTPGAPVVQREDRVPLCCGVGARCAQQSRSASLREDVAIAVLTGGKERPVSATRKPAIRQGAPTQVTDSMRRGVGEPPGSRFAQEQDFRDASSAHLVVTVVDARRESVERLGLAAPIAFL